MSGAVETREVMKLSRKAKFRAAALMVGCGLAVATLELALRIANPLGVRERASWHFLLWEGMRASADPELVWEHVPGWSRELPRYSVRINSMGLRGTEVGVRGEDAFRVLVLGDSMTFGMSAEEEDTAPAQLQAILDGTEGTGAVEVVNGGVLGYTSLQEAALLERLLPQVEPDLVILWWFHNDLVLTGAANPASQADELRDLIGIRPRTAARTVLHAAYEALPCTMALARALTVGRTDGDATAFAFDATQHAEAWTANREALLRIAAACRARGVPLAVFTFRHYVEIEQFCADQETAYGFAMRDAGEAEALRYGVNRWDPHFTREGNGVVAKAMAQLATAAIVQK